MKKLIILSIFSLMWFVVHSQTTVSLTPDTTGTIIGVDNATTTGGNVHTFKSPQITGGPYFWSLEVYVTIAGTHATDSTRVVVYSSMDGTNYTQLTYADLGIPKLAGAGTATATTTYYQGVAPAGEVGARRSSAGTGAGGWNWHPTTPLTYRYIMVKIYQLKALSTCTVNKCRLHLFK